MMEEEEDFYELSAALPHNNKREEEEDKETNTMIASSTNSAKIASRTRLSSSSSSASIFTRKKNLRNAAKKVNTNNIRLSSSTSSEEQLIASENISDMPPLELDDKGIERVKLQKNGWETYKYQDKFDCNYISAGKENTGPIVVLVHGFGAHSYHWRYQIPYLAKKGYRVYALCMLGYGWSSKASEEQYCMEYWGEQVSDFVRTIAKATETDKAFIAGNSIGALAALYAASKGAPERTKGLCLVNAAGNFEPNAAPGPEKKTMAQKAVGTAQEMEEAEENNTLQGKLRVAFGKLAAYGIFYFTKIRIKTILNQVYDNDVDEDLVRSIAMAAEDPEARETFYAISLAGSRTQVKPRDLLENLNAPVMLLWGENDPWMTPTKAERIMEIKPSAIYSPVPAGHCPQDDNPTDSNNAFVKWAETVA